MTDPDIPVIDILFTLIVFVAVLAIVRQEYAEWVLAATVLGIIWQAVQLFGASLFLATIIVMIFATVQAVFILIGSDGIDLARVAPFLEELFTRDEAEQTTPDRQMRDQHRKDNDH